MSKRTSKYGVMYDDKQSKAYLDKIVFGIISEVKFNIEIGDTLPFKIVEKLSPSMSSNETTYIAKELADCGIIINPIEMIVEELL